jgi:hypothetical protein
MRLTIIPEDGSVYKDNYSYSNLDLSFVPSNVHAFQWYDTYGEIEFKREFVNGVFNHPSNKPVVALPDWAVQCVSKWDEADAARLVAEQSSQAQEITQ